jgi:aspartate-semialdehyde dehydrogenase
LGADDPLGEAILRLISERDVEVGAVHPLSLAESDGCVTLKGEELPLLDVAEFDWRQADLLINAVRSPAARRLEAVAAAAGCRVIGLAADGNPGERMAVAGGLSVAVQRALAPVQRIAPLEAVSLTAMLPVAVAGEAGVAELAAQTRALFAMESPEPEVFPLQIAFNLVPQVGAPLADGSVAFEASVVAELKALLGDSGISVSVLAMWAPLFYGTGVAVHGLARGEIDLAGLKAALSAQDGVTLMDVVLPGGVPTPATDALESDTVFVGRLQCSTDSPRRFSMWLVADMIRLEATSIVDYLENLIEK